MRLTNLDRDAFIRAVVDDVPSIDHDEKARGVVLQWSIARMPATVARLYKTSPEWFARDYIDMPGCLQSAAVILNCTQNEMRLALRADKETFAALESLSEQKSMQRTARRALEAKVKAVIYSCNTVEQAHERLPEFASYLKATTPAADRSVPVVANLVSDLVAAGWPKGKKVAKVRKAA